MHIPITLNPSNRVWVKSGWLSYSFQKSLSGEGFMLSSVFGCTAVCFRLEDENILERHNTQESQNDWKTKIPVIPIIIN